MAHTLRDPEKGAGQVLHRSFTTTEAVTTTLAGDADHCSYRGQTIEAVQIILTDRIQLNSLELGIEILSTLRVSARPDSNWKVPPPHRRKR